MPFCQVFFVVLVVFFPYPNALKTSRLHFPIVSNGPPFTFPQVQYHLPPDILKTAPLGHFLQTFGPLAAHSLWYLFRFSRFFSRYANIRARWQKSHTFCPISIRRLVWHFLHIANGIIHPPLFLIPKYTRNPTNIFPRLLFLSRGVVLRAVCF